MRKRIFRITSRASKELKLFPTFTKYRKTPVHSINEETFALSCILATNITLMRRFTSSSKYFSSFWKKPLMLNFTYWEMVLQNSKTALNRPTSGSSVALSICMRLCIIDFFVCPMNYGAGMKGKIGGLWLRASLWLRPPSEQKAFPSPTARNALSPIFLRNSPNGAINA